ncbi:sulfatase-like hydrolase/transferase [Thermococcus sp.]
MADEPNIILIIMDTLRKDYAGIIENILKKNGFIAYENTISPSPWTLPSHASILTGLYSALHGTHESRNRKNPDITFNPIGLNPLHVQLQDRGYTTYLLSANPYLTPSFGFKGFEHFYDTYSGKYSLFLSNREQEEFDSLKAKYSTGTEIVKAMITKRKYFLLLKSLAGIGIWKSGFIRTVWPFDMGAKRTFKLIKKLPLEKNQPFFLFSNLMEAHEPYHRSESPHALIESFMDNLARGYLNWGQVALWRKIYPKEVEYLGAKVLELLSILKQKKILSNTMIIITSDHGQLIGDHGRIGHGVFLYDELIRVPLFIKYPETIEANSIETPADDNRNAYISLTTLKKFILNIATGNEKWTESLFSHVAFSETYGIQDRVPAKKYKNYEIHNLSLLEKYRVAVYYKGAKGIFNVSDWKFETISVHSSTTSLEDIQPQLKKKVLQFLKSTSRLKQLKKSVNP